MSNSRWWFSIKKDGKYSRADTVWAAGHADAHTKALKKLKDGEEIGQLRTWWPGCGIA